MARQWNTTSMYLEATQDQRFIVLSNKLLLESIHLDLHPSYTGAGGLAGGMPIREIPSYFLNDLN